MGRNPVDRAELQRDHDETYGTAEEIERDRYNYELDQADKYYGWGED